MQRLVFSVLLMTISGAAVAAGNAQQGKDTAVLCIGCHGSDGNSSSNSDFPKLAAQGANYLAKQLRDFKSAARKEQHMSSMVEAISADDIPNLAAWFSSQSRTMPGTDKVNAAGRRIFLEGNAQKGVSACASCHGEDGRGNDAAGFPSLSGQYAEYVARQLMSFRAGSRSNDGMIMQGIAKELSDTDIENLAGFIGGMQ